MVGFPKMTALKQGTVRRIRPGDRFILAHIAVVLFVFGLLLVPDGAFAFPVDPLPEGNLIPNPWFHAAGNPNKASEENWVDEQDLWGLSRKPANPSPFVEQGTAARFAEPASPRDMGPGPYGGADAYLYTILQANSSHPWLKFKTHWVSANIEIAEVTVYGSSTPDGPWLEVWKPLLVTPEKDAHFEWQETDVSYVELGSGFDYYKIEYHARYSADEQWGFKFTGVYFSTAQEGDGSTSPTPQPTATDEAAVEPTLVPTETKTPPPTNAPDVEEESSPVSESNRRRRKPESGGIVKHRD